MLGHKKRDTSYYDIQVFHLLVEELTLVLISFFGRIAIFGSLMGNECILNFREVQFSHKTVQIWNAAYN